AETRARLPAAAMAPAGAPLANEAGLVEREPDEGVGQGHAVIAPGEVVEVPHVEAGVPVARPVALAIQAQDALDLRDGRFATRGLAATPVVQAQDAVALIPSAPAAQAARMNAEDVGALQPGQGPSQHAADHLLDFHGPLHSDRGIEHGWPPFHPWPYRGRLEERTFQLLSGADRSCAPYTGYRHHCRYP